MLSNTGIRVGEGLALRWEDLQPGDVAHIKVQRGVTRGRIETTKTGGTRSVEVAKDLMDHLLSLPRISDWLFPNGAGNPYDQKDASRECRAINVAARIPTTLTPHSWRHFFASYHLSEGRPLQWVMEQGGWTSVQLMAERYGSWLRAKSPGAVDALAVAVTPQALSA